MHIYIYTYLGLDTGEKEAFRNVLEIKESRGCPTWRCQGASGGVVLRKCCFFDEPFSLGVRLGLNLFSCRVSFASFPKDPHALAPDIDCGMTRVRSTISLRASLRS